MQKIPIRLAQAEMILAQPVLDAEGRTLVGEGVTLSASIIARLESSGIRTLTIKGDPGGPSASQKVLDRLDHLFRKQNDPFMLALRQMLGEYYRRKVAFEKVGGEE